MVSLNNLIVNTDKTIAMFFHNYQMKNPGLPYVIFDGSAIPVSTDTKFLGIHVNESLKWNHHYEVLKSKLNTGYYLISFFAKNQQIHISYERCILHVFKPI